MKQEIITICENLTETNDAINSLDIATDVQPLFYVDNGFNRKAEGYKGVLNVSTGKITSVVSSGYNIVNHREYLTEVVNTLQRLNMDFTMKLANTGDKVWADFKLKDQNINFVNLDEKFATGFRVHNSYDKQSGLFIAPLYTRLACTNGMVMTSQGRNMSVRHTNKLADEISKFVETRINMIINEHKDLQYHVSRCIGDSIEWETACKIVFNLIDRKKHIDKILDNLGIALIITPADKEKNIKKKINFVWNVENEKKDELSRWDVYNAITQYATHGEHLTPLVQQFMQEKAEKILRNKFSEMESEIVIHER